MRKEFPIYYLGDALGGSWRRVAEAEVAYTKLVFDLQYNHNKSEAQWFLEALQKSLTYANDVKRAGIKLNVAPLEVLVSNMQALDEKVTLEEHLASSSNRQGLENQLDNIINSYRETIRDFPQSSTDAYDAIFDLAIFQVVWGGRRLKVPVTQPSEYLAYFKVLRPCYLRLTNYGLDLERLDNLISQANTGASLQQLELGNRDIILEIGQTFLKGY